MKQEPAFACDLSVMTKSEMERLVANSQQLLAAADELRVLPDGYALAYRDASAEMLAKLADFIAFDRLCCSFLRHALVSEPGRGATVLEMTGPAGAKEALTDEVLRLVRPEVARAAGLTPSNPGARPGVDAPTAAARTR
jgi:hypothetical protein